MIVITEAYKNELYFLHWKYSTSIFKNKGIRNLDDSGFVYHFSIIPAL